MSPDETKRLFVGTYLSSPQQEVLGRLSERKTDLERQLECRARFVKPVKLHLTWLFLGDVDTSKLLEIQTKLESVATKMRKLEIQYEQVELWPSAKRPRMIVLTPLSVADAVNELASAIDGELNTYVSKKGHREYRPHITLARLERENFKAHAVKVPDWLVSQSLLPIVHEIDRIELIESELGRSGDQYNSIQSFSLHNP